MTKQVSISADDVTYYLLPGGTGEVTRDGVSVEDTIFGQTYRSGFTGPIAWGINANAIYKGYPGYGAKLFKPGTSTAMTDEAAALVSGKTYQITDTAKRCINRAVAVVVEDNAVNHTADVESIDYLFGRVTFKSTYTVTGSVTITGEYFPMSTALAQWTGYTLTMTADPIRNSHGPALQTNGGYHTHTPGLKTVALELPTVFSSSDDWPEALDNRSEYILEVNPDAQGWNGSIARGFFRLMTQRQSGDVGALEEENLRFELNVPYYGTQPLLDKAFGWNHHVSSPIPIAVKTALDRWLADLSVYARYLHDGTNGWKGQGVLTSLSLTGGLEATNMFEANVQMSGAPTDVP
jgi:hypothetical protein